MKIAITGHRPNKLGNDYDLTSPLIQNIKRKIITILDERDHEYLTLITGMALGIDTLFAQIAIESNLPFIAAIPCKNQEKKWPEKSQKIFRDIVLNDLCTFHLVTKEEYSPFCMQKRNEWMVNNCDLLIAVWDGSSGGTANCVNYAVSKVKPIIYINPKDFKL